VVTHPEKCVNCRLCEALCPEFAIWNTLEDAEGDNACAEGAQEAEAKQ